MTTKVIQLSSRRIDELQTLLAPALAKKTPQHALFQAKWQGVTITAYQTGKVVLQGHDLEHVLHQLKQQLDWDETTLQANVSSKPSSALPENFSSWSVIGSDEVGNGSYFGPLTVAATYVDANRIALLQELGVKDSKHLSDQQIQTLAPQIKASVPYKILVLNPPKYNEVQQTMNLNEMKAKLHNQALNLLQQQIAPASPTILIDQFCEPKTYFRYLNTEKNVVKENVYFATKAEQHHLAVAAASILARDAFLTSLSELEHRLLEQQICVSLPSGANQTVDRVAATILRHGGMNLLKQVAKLHFANTTKAQNLLKK